MREVLRRDGSRLVAVESERCIDGRPAVDLYRYAPNGECTARLTVTEEDALRYMLASTQEKEEEL